MTNLDQETLEARAIEAADAASGNQFQEGPFAPVSQEVTAYDLEVLGTIPTELEGRFLRVGPNPVDPEDPRTYCWFTGCGMVHGVRLAGGRAEWYRNRFVADDQVVRSRGLPAVPGPRQFGQGPKYVATNVVNTHAFWHAGRTWAFAEAGVLPIELTYELGTVCRSDFGGTLNGSWTGHPHRLPETDELHAVSYRWDWDHVSYHILGTDGRLRKTLDIPVPASMVVHDIALTKRFAVFLDGPITFRPQLMQAGFAFPYLWDFDYQTRWGLVPHEAESPDEVIWCEVEPTTVFHILNAFDLPDGKVALDGVSYPRLFVEDLRGPTESAGRLDRFVFDPVAGTTHVECLDDRAQEMPRLDERLTGARHRYGYFSSRGSNGQSSLLKQDLVAGRTESYDYGPGRMGMEAVFVPRTPESEEDDGWLMTFVTDMGTQTSEMAIFGAQDVRAGPVATIRLPQRVPLGFHGNWIADADLKEARP